MLLYLLASCAIVGTEAPRSERDESPQPDAVPAPDSPDRAAWVVEALDAHNAALTAADRHTKYCRMAASPFVFYRGTAHLWWAEVTALAELHDFGGDDAAQAWVQGDLHIDNFGTFHNDNDVVVWDINDFDEGVVGDFQLDLWRLTTSVELVARERSWTSEALPQVVAAAYLDRMTELANGGSLGSSGLTASEALGPVQALLLDVSNDSREHMLDKWTSTTDGQRRFNLDDPRLAPVTDSTHEALVSAWPDYRTSLTGGMSPDATDLDLLDVAARLDAGTGSLGTPRYYVLTRGHTTDSADDLILDVKRQAEPSAWPYLNATAQSAQSAAWDNHAQRVTLAQRALRDDVDDTLGWLSLPDGDYSVRQRSPWKDSLDLDDVSSPAARQLVSSQWGDLTAQDHARAGSFRPLLTPQRIEATVTTRAAPQRERWLTHVATISAQLADGVEQDYDTFMHERAPTDCAHK